MDRKIKSGCIVEVNGLSSLFFSPQSPIPPFTISTMDLDAQIQLLVNSAPQDGATPEVVATIAPVLKVFAQRLRHRQYYILQTTNQEWMMTTLSNRARPDLEKRVIYAFPTLEDARSSVDAPRPANLVAVALPVVHILFQMVALQTIDSLIFFETSGNLENGIEIPGGDVRKAIQIQLQQKLSVPPSVPPNLA
jgi:hypothetical protein